MTNLPEDNKVKLLRIQTSLLRSLQNEKDKTTPGSLEYGNVRAKIADSLSDYVKLVTQIDREMYHKLQEKVNFIANSNFGYEEELKYLVELEVFYNNYISVQEEFKNTHRKYSDDELSLSPVEDLNISYYLKRKDIISNYLNNKKSIIECKKKIVEYNDKLYENEQAKEKLDKIIVSLDEELKNRIASSEGRIVSHDGTLKYASIENELKSNGIVYSSNGIDEENYNLINEEADAAKEKMQVATISYDVMPSIDKRDILNGIKDEFINANYKMVLARLIKNIFTPSKDYDDAVEKRNSLLELLEYRKRDIKEMGIEYGLDPFSRLNVADQLVKLKVYQNVVGDVESCREKLSSYNREIDELEANNEEYLMQLNVHNEKVEKEIVEDTASFNNFKEVVEDTFVEPTSQEIVLDNQVISSKKSSINYKRSKDRALAVAKRVIELLNKDRQVKSNVNPELVIEAKDTMFIEEDPFEVQKPVRESVTEGNDNSSIIDEDLFTIDESITSNNDSKTEDLFSEKEPFVDPANQIVPETNEVEDNLFSDETPFVDDVKSKEEDLFSDLEPFNRVQLFSEKTDDDAEMPDISMFMEDETKGMGKK